MAKAAETRVSVDNIDLLPYYYIPEYWKEREDRGKGGLPVDDEEWDMVDFKSIREIADAGAAFIRVCNYYTFVTAIYQFLFERSLVSGVWLKHTVVVLTNRR
jgi:hypothetical protein